jgi:hypothetical protein
VGMARARQPEVGASGGRVAAFYLLRPPHGFRVTYCTVHNICFGFSVESVGVAFNSICYLHTSARCEYLISNT